jgi:hypothetical protein
MKDVPLSVIDDLEDYKKYPSIYRVDIRQSTREALWFIKKQNQMTMMCDVIDLLINTVCFSQMSDTSKNILKSIYASEKGNKRRGKSPTLTFRQKEIIVGSKRYRSLKICAEELGIHRKTVEYRLKSLKPKWKHWQYVDDYGYYNRLQSTNHTLGEGKEDA